MKVSRIDHDEFNISLHRGELSIIRIALQDMRANLCKKSANCSSCGIRAAEVRWMIDPINKVIKEYEESIKEER